MKVNVVSESAFTVQGHGVHTAYTETIDALREYTDCEVQGNGHNPADIVHVHTTGPYALAKLLWARGAKVVSAHVTPDSFVGSVIGAKYWYGIAKVYLRWYYNLADAVLAVSDEVMRELKSMGVHKPIYLVPNTIRVQAFANSPEIRAAARKKLGIDKKAFVVVGNGQVQPRKRIDVFVAAAKQLPEIQFVWVGGIPFKRLGADSAKMEEMMIAHPSNLKFSGLLSRDDVVAYYQASDLFFLPSIQETFGLVIVEAAAAGLPVLLRDLDQYRETFAGAYEVGDDNNFAQVIERFAGDEGYYKKWQAAAESIAKKYDAKTGAKRLMQVYRETIAARHKAKAEAV